MRRFRRDSRTPEQKLARAAYQSGREHERVQPLAQVVGAIGARARTVAAAHVRDARVKR